MSNQDRIRFHCPHCHKRVRVKPKGIGMEVHCPNTSCGQLIVVPDSSETEEQQPGGSSLGEDIGYGVIKLFILLAIFVGIPWVLQLADRHVVDDTVERVRDAIEKKAIEDAVRTSGQVVKPDKKTKQ